MSYTKQTWQTGDTITAEKLNHIEVGIDDANQQLSGITDSISDAYDATASYVVGAFCINDNTLYRCNTAIPTGGEAWTPDHWDAVQIVDLLGSGAVSDVQINGASILSDGVANIPLASGTQVGAIRINTDNGTGLSVSGGRLSIYPASDSDIKGSWGAHRVLTPPKQHAAAFYGLAKAAGDTTQSQSSNPVGTYTEAAKTAIKSMLGVAGGGMNIVSLTGTQVTQVGADNTFYVCGELTELTFTAPATGITMIRFTSGTTPTVLTINGVTGWMFGFDTTALEANKVYDLSFLNGVGCAGWV